MGPCPRSSIKDKLIEASIAHHGAVSSGHGGVVKVQKAGHGPVSAGHAPVPV